MEHVKLITEVTQDVDVVCESKDGDEQLYIEGIFMQSEKMNRNGRIYPKDTLVKEATRYNKEFVQTHRAMGELGHPEGPSVNLDRVSHLITKLESRDNDVYGKAKLLETPTGKIAKSLIKEGVKLGVSTRGMGSIHRKDGANIVGEDFMLAAVDIVADPSAPDAFVNGIMEGKEWVWQNGALKEVQIESYKNQINSSQSKKELEENILRVWNHFLRG
jgi:hypothetical protein